MSEQVKMTYLPVSALVAALASVSAKGLPIRVFPATKEGAKDAFSGYIQLVPGTETVGAQVVGVHFYKTKADGSALVDKNGVPYMSATVGNRDEQLRGAVFTNTKRDGKNDADIRIVINTGKDTSVEGKLWISEPKNGGSRYYSGSIASRAEAEAAPAEAVAPTPAPAEAVADPFGL